MRKFNVDAIIRQGGNKRYSVGNGLSLYVRGASALWIYQFRDQDTKKTRSMSLGSAKGYEAMTISEARDARVRLHASLLDGTVPALRAVTGKSFGDALQAYLDTHAAAWTGGVGGREAGAHRRLLDLDFAKLPLSRIDTAAVRQALAPWDGKATSKKLRTKIKSVIDFAKASGWFHGENPAAHETIGKLLPTITKAKHHDAMPWAVVPAFMRGLAAFDTSAARALMFTILTAARTGETQGATWSEIQDDVWVIGERMKEGVPHCVPLTSEALALVGQRGEPDALIFTTAAGKHLHAMAMRAYVKGRGCAVHGFRSTFTDWAAEHGYSRELRELALAHAIGNTVERSYRRSNMIAERRPMMQAWAAFTASA